ncbi:CaiB/BaiF CoA-transferase family protein [Crossiella sp. CA-258035]|uniref:CaiB/BaiF CoA transferase family protein n=1 Tax=Crossiella sp. CA-258035 TaxID=2981138 RepID=UPI0024BC30A5|nr:CaiB/BaiF CoA-transferase family protein [Crossiella sp. CA-258035]WHT18562.1 CaiB/BaiF CoA-transferase family protein [Crossiella sp. CA-258035]
MAGPLSGIRVVELSGLGPGPFAGMLLADLGADVVVVQRPGGSVLTGTGRYDVLNRGKRSLVANLKDPAEKELVLRLAERADVLLEGFRPGVTERLGLGPEDCWARNPKLVYGRMTGWGQDGPWSSMAGHDIGYIAVTGALGAIGRAGGPPQVPLNLLGDFGGGGMYLVVGVLAALLSAKTTGKGQVVDAAIVDGTAHLATLIFGMLASGGWKDERGANMLDTGAPYYDVYPTADDRHLAVGAIEPQFFAELLTKLDLADKAPPQHDTARWPELRALIGEAVRAQPLSHWAKVFDGSDACAAPVLNLAEAPDHPHLAARGTFTERDGVRQPAPAPRFSHTPNAPVGPPPAPGEHTEEVLTDWDVSRPA